MAGIFVRAADAVHAGLARQLHRMHAGRAARGQPFAQRRAALEAGQDQPGRALQQVAVQQPLLFGGVVVGDADQRLKARRPERAVRGLEQIDEDLVRQGRHQHDDLRAVRRGQRPRRRIGHVGPSFAAAACTRATSSPDTVGRPRSAREAVIGLTWATAATSCRVTRPVARERAGDSSIRGRGARRGAVPMPEASAVLWWLSSAPSFSVGVPALQRATGPGSLRSRRGSAVRPTLPRARADAP